MQDMKRLLKYLGPYRKDMLIGALLIFVETCFELFIPCLLYTSFPWAAMRDLSAPGNGWKRKICWMRLQKSITGPIEKPMLCCPA